MNWTLRYASHLGYRSSDSPLFRASVGSLDPVKHIDFAAGLGFAGVQYALAVTRPVDEQLKVGAALAKHGMETGCILWSSFDVLRSPLWGSSERHARDQILRELESCIEVACRVNAKHIAVIGAAFEDVSIAQQQARMIENLKWASEKAQKSGVVLCLESISTKSLSNMLVHHISDAQAIVKAVDSPAVKLIFDTSHVQIMDGDVIGNLESCWDDIAIVQLADNPGRLELGSGELNFLNILRVIKRRNYRGLVELEHQWSGEGIAIEQREIRNLRAMDQLLENDDGRNPNSKEKWNNSETESTSNKKITASD